MSNKERCLAMLLITPPIFFLEMAGFDVAVITSSWQKNISSIKTAPKHTTDGMRKYNQYGTSYNIVQVFQKRTLLQPQFSTTKTGLKDNFSYFYAMQKKLYLLDAFALVFRAYYALIRSPRITSTGRNTNAQFGFTNAIIELINNQKPTHMAVCFDTHALTERHTDLQIIKRTDKKHLKIFYRLFRISKKSLKDLIFLWLKWMALKQMM